MYVDMQGSTSPKVGRLYRQLEGFFREMEYFFEEAAGCLHVDMSENVSGALLRFSRVSLPELSLVKLHLWQRYGGAVDLKWLMK